VGILGGKNPGLGSLGPRQFAYKPDDIRFYFPPTLNNPLPSNYQQLQQGRGEKSPDSRLSVNDEEDPRYREPIRDSREDLSASFPFQPNTNNNNNNNNNEPLNDNLVDAIRKQQQKQQQQQMEDSLHYMKKSQPEVADFERSNSESPPASTTNNESQNQTPYETHSNEIPSHIMASPHDAMSPNVISSPLGKTGSDWQISSFYYIGTHFFLFLYYYTIFIIFKRQKNYQFPIFNMRIYILFIIYILFMSNHLNRYHH
jgi:hypothetical protein